MKLHLNDKLFKEAVEATAQLKGISTIYVEKDYWVTYALYLIFHDPIGEETIFKGGTALSKCFGLIQRFSEDLDLVVMRSEKDSANQLKNKLKRIGAIVHEHLPEEEVDGLTHKTGMSRKTAHNFTKLYKGKYGQIRDSIILEATWLGYYEPFTEKEVSSFIHEMMIEKGQQNIATAEGLLPFTVKVLEPTRTFCEKIMSLVRFSYTDTPIIDLKNKIRHTYDLHMMLQEASVQEFFNSDKFPNLLLKVAEDDVRSFKNNNKWLVYHSNESYFFKDLEKVWAELVETYTGDFSNLVYASSLPDEKDILASLNRIKEQLKGVSWNITLPEE